MAKRRNRPVNLSHALCSPSTATISLRHTYPKSRTRMLSRRSMWNLLAGLNLAPIGIRICRVIPGEVLAGHSCFGARKTNPISAVMGTVGTGSRLFGLPATHPAHVLHASPCLREKPRSAMSKAKAPSRTAMSRISFERRVAILSRYSTRRQGFESCLCLHVSFTTQSLCSCVGKIWLPNPPSHGAHPNLRRHSTSYIPSCACALEPDYMALARADSPG